MGQIGNDCTASGFSTDAETAASTHEFCLNGKIQMRWKSSFHLVLADWSVMFR